MITRMFLRPISRTTSLLVLSAALLTSACSTAPKPHVLQEATDRIKSSETTEVEDIQPRLIREARQYEIKARKAYERGDLERTKLYAHLAIQRYDTARNLVERDASEQLSGLMATADQELSVEESKLAQEQREVARYEQLESRFSSVKSELAQVREDQQGAAAQARRLLLKARSSQAEALGAGASAVDPETYAQARLEIENALEAYDSELFAESSSASQRAISSFEQLTEKSMESAQARRKAEKEMLAKNAERNAQRGEGQDRAQKAIDEASDSQTTAIGARMPQTQQALYQQGVFMLESAERRLRDGDYDGSVSKANDARDIFLSASKDANIASAEMTLGEDSEGGTSKKSANSEVLNAIQRAEDARGGALARGAQLSDMSRGDYALELARTARDRQEDNRAIQKAGEAAALYEGLSAAPAAVVATSGEMTEAPSSSSRGLKKLAEEQIIRLQLERAEALGDMVDEECAGQFREFEAVLELAQQRFDAKDYAQSFEFSVRASERLKQCDEPTRRPAKVSATTSSSKPSAEERAEQKARAEAASALSSAQGDYAVLDATLEGDDTSKLREPAVLIATAERWFKQNDYPQAEALAKRASASMEAIKLEQAAPKKKDDTKALAESTASVKTLTKTPEELAEEARQREACVRVDAIIDQVKGAQMRASSVSLDDDNEARYKRAIRTLNRANDLRDDQRCESSELLAEESLASFEEVLRVNKKNVEDAARAEEKAKQEDTKTPAVIASVQQPVDTKEDAAARERKEQRAADAASAIAAAQLARAQVESQSKNNVYVTANSLLKEAERAQSGGKHANAEGLAKQAQGAFKSLDANAPVTNDKGEEVDPSWKPAYSKVLDALILRDEVKAQIGEPEQEVFARGVNNLERSRRSWDTRDFMAAARFSEAAKSDFNKALQASKQRAKDEEAARQKMIADENEAERQARLKKEKEEAAAAKQAELDAAKQAKADAEAAEKASEQERIKLRRAADDVIREANIKRDLCDKEFCSLRDELALVRANETLQSAEGAFTGKDFERAKELASAALLTYENTLKKPRKFAITSKVSRVTYTGDRLILSPKVKFESGTTVIVAESNASIDELAQVLRENASTLKDVKLVGYTDSRGNDKKNLALSEKRAAAVMKALIDRGVSRDVMTSKGLGEANPVATNKTAEGRELNRRVEVIIETQQGE